MISSCEHVKLMNGRVWPGIEHFGISVGGGGGGKMFMPPMVGCGGRYQELPNMSPHTIPSYVLLLSYSPLEQQSTVLYYRVLIQLQEQVSNFFV